MTCSSALTTTSHSLWIRSHWATRSFLCVQQVVVLDRQQATSGTPNVLQDHLITSDVSVDLRALSLLKRRGRRSRRSAKQLEPADHGASNGAEPLKGNPEGS